MSKISGVKRIVAEDYAKEYQQLVSRLGYILNGFMDESVDIINGGLNFDNLAFNLVTFDITVDADGKPIINNKVNINKTNPTGFNVIRAINLNNTAVYPISQPFISFVPGADGVMTVTNISGLQGNSKYRITAVVY